MSADPCAWALTYSRVLEPDEEGCLAHLTSVFGCSEEKIVTEALQYVFGRSGRTYGCPAPTRIC